jgi:hypothetical protein
MTKSIPAVFRNGQIRPLVPLDLPEDTPLEIVVPSEDLEAGGSTIEADPLATIGEIAEDLGPPDLSRRLDHYLYGTPNTE